VVFNLGYEFPPGVCEDILGGMREHLTGYIKLKNNSGGIKLKINYIWEHAKKKWLIPLT
jgi:hypothetical protein